MRFSGSFCAVFLFHIVRISAASDEADIEENPSLIENYEGSIEQTDDEPAKHPLVRNKRHFDYSDYSSSDSSDESNFGYFYKPQYHHGYDTYWYRPTTPPPRPNGYGFWPIGPEMPEYRPQYHHHHNHNGKQCKFPHESRGHFGIMNTDDKPKYPITTPTSNEPEPETPSIVVTTTSTNAPPTPETPSSPLTTTSANAPPAPETPSSPLTSTSTSAPAIPSTSTETIPFTSILIETTTEYVPPIDIRSRV